MYACPTSFTVHLFTSRSFLYTHANAHARKNARWSPPYLHTRTRTCMFMGVQRRFFQSLLSFSGAVAICLINACCNVSNGIGTPMPVESRTSICTSGLLNKSQQCEQERYPPTGEKTPYTLAPAHPLSKKESTRCDTCMLLHLSLHGNAQMMYNPLNFLNHGKSNH